MALAVQVKIYVVVRAALQEFGEFTMVTTEKAFTDKSKAEAFVKAYPVTWNENLQGVNYVCERAIHEVDLLSE